MPIRVPLSLFALVATSSGFGVALQRLQSPVPPPAPEVVRAAPPALDAAPLLRPLRDCALLTAAENGVVTTTASHLQRAVEETLAAEPTLTGAAIHVHDLRTEEVVEVGGATPAIPLDALKLPGTLAAARTPAVDLAGTLATLEIRPVDGRLTPAQALRPWTVLYNATLLDAAGSQRLLEGLPQLRTPATEGTVIEERSAWGDGAAACGLVYGAQRMHARCVTVSGADPASVSAGLDRVLATVDAEMARFRLASDARATR